MCVCGGGAARKVFHTAALDSEEKAAGDTFFLALAAVRTHSHLLKNAKDEGKNSMGKKKTNQPTNLVILNTQMRDTFVRART